MSVLGGVPGWRGPAFNIGGGLTGSLVIVLVWMVPVAVRPGQAPDRLLPQAPE